MRLVQSMCACLCVRVGDERTEFSARPTSTRRRVHVTLGARMATVVWSILDEHELSLQVVALVPIPLPFALKATHDDARRNSNLAGEGPDLAVGR
jgi:hypothetical protein